MAVYLLHIDPPFKNRVKHYVGFTMYNDCENRVDQHIKGRGAKLTRLAVEAGCTITVVKIWPEGDRAFERKLKRIKKASRFCPRCGGEMVI